MTGELLALNILTPAAAGIACYALRSRVIRIVIVALASIVLIASSIMLSFTGGFSYSPPAILDTMVSFLGFALVAYFFYRGLKLKEIKILGLAAIQLLFLAFVELQGFNETSNIFIIDSLGVLMNVIINVIGSIVCVYSIGYMDEHEKMHQGNGRQPRFFLFMFLLLGAMNGLVFSNSIYWLALFWEVTTLCCFELIRHSRTEEAERNAATALWMSLVGGVALAGTLVISTIYYNIPAFDSLSTSLSNQSILFIFSLMAIAAFTKSAQFPFQKWLLGAMVAPTPVSALLHSSTMVNAGAYLILRIAPSLSESPLTLVIAFGGALTFVLTAVLAIRQRMAKSVLAYSTIGNLGLIILCAGLNTPLSYSAAIILLLFHSASKGMLFMGAGIVENRIESRKIEDWEGLMGRFPFTSTVMIIGMASMFLPPFGMLLGKWVALEAVASATPWVAVLLVMALVLGSTATTFFWVKWLGHLIILPVVASKIVRERL
ncbi:MAG: hypothetical protein LUP94_02770, partial [Candidatus Methanomethylicus sp.]|nr:hypothetical protein [Candidatus Methanomethylicus sp.]